MRVIVVALMALLLLACSSPRSAEDAYKEGNYLESVELITLDIEEKGEAKLDADDLARFRRIIGDVMGYYENQLLTAGRTDYASRINSYKALLNMKKRLSNRFYSQQIYFFNNKYDIKSLREVIAEEYYLYGNSINAIDRQSYYRKAMLYRNGMEQYKYKDIEALYQNTYTQYMQVAAKEYYEQAKIFVGTKEYKEAAEYFAKASDVYQPLGQYKDSDQLFIVYDKKYRTIEANHFYQQGKQIGQNAVTHYEYRQMAALFEQAVLIYSPYGQYLDATNLAKIHQEKGKLKIYFPSGRFNRLIEQHIRKKDYIVFVNNPISADIVIKINDNQQYREFPGRPKMQAMSENMLEKTITVTNEQGQNETKDIYKTHHFNIQMTEFSNLFVLTTMIDVSGLYSYTKHNRIEKSSNITRYVYSGDVPNKYQNHQTGKYLSQSTLADQASREQQSMLRYELTHLSSIFERL